MPIATNQTEEYIQLNKILGYKRSIYMILTDRGFGKTYAVKVQFVREFLKYGKKFIYLRRYKPEMKMINTFFDDILMEFPDVEFKVKGWNLYANNKICGMGMVLTRYQDYKGGAYPKYDNLLYEEFLREKVKAVGYLPNDTEAFLSICDSVFRKRKGVKAIMLSNTVNEVNPYFIDFKIIRKNNSEYAKSSDPILKDRIICYIRELDLEQKEKNGNESDFRQVLNAVEKYANTNLGNKFNDSDDTFVKRKSKDAEFWFGIRVNKYDTLGVWVDYNEPRIYVSRKCNTNTKYMYAFSKDTHNDKTILVQDFKRYNHFIKLVKAFKQSQLAFETLEVKMMMFDLLSKMRIF